MPSNNKNSEERHLYSDSRTTTKRQIFKSLYKFQKFECYLIVFKSISKGRFYIDVLKYLTFLLKTHYFYTEEHNLTVVGNSPHYKYLKKNLSDGCPNHYMN